MGCRGHGVVLSLGSSPPQSEKPSANQALSYNPNPTKYGRWAWFIREASPLAREKEPMSQANSVLQKRVLKRCSLIGSDLDEIPFQDIWSLLRKSSAPLKCLFLKEQQSVKKMAINFRGKSTYVYCDEPRNHSTLKQPHFLSLCKGQNKNHSFCLQVKFFSILHSPRICT